MKLIYILPVFVTPLLFSVCQRPAAAQSVSLNPVADAFVFTGETGSNYGGGGVFAVTAPGVGFPAAEFRSLIRFDLASAKANFDAAFGAGNWSLGSAVLNLGATSPNNLIFNSPAAGQLQFTWMQNDTWEEGAGAPTTPDTNGVTWDSLPTFLSANDQSLGTFAFDGATSGTVSYSLGLAPGLVNDAASGGLTSLLLTGAPGDTTVSAAFNSRSFNTASRRPLLTLNAVAIPEPGAWALAVCGVLAFAFLRIARQNFSPPL
jgi:hypothetical protein